MAMSTAEANLEPMTSKTKARRGENNLANSQVPNFLSSLLFFPFLVFVLLAPFCLFFLGLNCFFTKPPKERDCQKKNSVPFLFRNFNQ